MRLYFMEPAAIALSKERIKPVAQDFEGLCLSRYPKLLGAMTLYLGDRALAEDITQEAFARAYVKWNSLKKAEAADLWLYRIAMNLAKSYFRRQMLERKLRSSTAAEPGRHEDPDVATAVYIRRAVASLPARQRSALVLRYFYDASVSQAAAAMDCSEGSIKRLTHQAIKSLRAQIPPGERTFVDVL